jgi:hypothetical protein
MFAVSVAVPRYMAGWIAGTVNPAASSNSIALMVGLPKQVYAAGRTSALMCLCFVACFFRPFFLPLPTSSARSFPLSRSDEATGVADGALLCAGVNPKTATASQGNKYIEWSEEWICPELFTVAI